MKRPLTVVLTLALATPLIAGTAGADDDLGSLQKRFKDRYPTLMRLRDDGRVGETSHGFAEAVRTSYLDDKIDPAHDKSLTIESFLAAENRDRRKLYELIAEKSGTTAAKVAERNAKRVFEKADPEHFLKLASGKWVKKKDLAKKTG